MSSVDDSAPFVQKSLELLDCQSLIALLEALIVVRSTADLVEFGIVEEVRRRLRHFVEDFADELFLIVDLEGVVVLELSLQAAEVSISNAFTTR